MLGHHLTNDSDPQAERLQNLMICFGQWPLDDLYNNLAMSRIARKPRSCLSNERMAAGNSERIDLWLEVS